MRQSVAVKSVGPLGRTGPSSTDGAWRTTGTAERWVRNGSWKAVRLPRADCAGPAGEPSASTRSAPRRLARARERATAPRCPVVVRHENVELAKLAEPARRVTPDEQRLVVGVRVALGATVTQNREDGPQELVRDGADRALVASPNHQRLVVRPELAVVSPSGGMRALDEHRSQGLVPGPSAFGPALAGTGLCAMALIARL